MSEFFIPHDSQQYKSDSEPDSLLDQALEDGLSGMPFIADGFPDYGDEEPWDDDMHGERYEED